MKIICFLAVILVVCSCGSDKERADRFFRHKLIDWNYSLTNVIISDIFSPPVASRIYAYCNIAAYEAGLGWRDPFQSLGHQLNGFEAPLKPEGEVYGPLAACIAFSSTAQNLVYNVDMLREFENAFLEKTAKTDLSQSVIEGSIAYGRAVGNAIIEWAKKDGYIERQAMPRHILSEEPGNWQPTPPDYMQGMEPYWYMIRTFALDSAAQFCPPPPTRFDTARGSAFYREAMEVYEAVNEADEEQVEIAKFWDCNPNTSHPAGHAVFFTQKISPGGHWITIAGIASKAANLSFDDTCEAHTLTSIALADAFISCWEAKYKTQLIRPITYINEYIDKEWLPLLQTPPFPEYPSGHSVVSNAAAHALTGLLGDSIPFVDTTEVRFGLPERSYRSFLHAANEASISRLYGGIHYRPAIEDGAAQGREIGEYVLQKLKIRTAGNIAATQLPD